jgi:cytochrome c oxidase cbb3-type subunit IV
MDINDVRIGTTVISFVMFVGIMVWTWSRRNKASFDEAARLPFRDEE